MVIEDCVRMLEGISGVLDLLGAGSEKVNDCTAVYELLTVCCDAVRDSLEHIDETDDVIEIGEVA